MKSYYYYFLNSFSLQSHTRSSFCEVMIFLHLAFSSSSNLNLVVAHRYHQLLDQISLHHIHQMHSNLNFTQRSNLLFFLQDRFLFFDSEGSYLDSFGNHKLLFHVKACFFKQFKKVSLCLLENFVFAFMR